MGIDLLNNSRVAVIRNVITEEDCKKLHDFTVHIKANNIDIEDMSAEDADAESDENIEYWRRKNVYLRFCPEEYQEIARLLHKRYKDIFREYLNLIDLGLAKYNENELEPIVVHVYQEGDSLDLHQDGRDFALVFYLSSVPEFTGGDLVYPNLGITLEPTRGTLIISPSNELHEVLTVTSGYRCAITTFISLR